MIYRVKRFSREKSYSILTDLYHSGVKRTAKKWIGRARVNAAKPFYEKSLEQYQKGIEAEQEIANKVDISPESKKKLRVALGQKAKELGVRINTGLPKKIKGSHSWTMDSKVLDRYLKEYPSNHKAVRKLRKSVERGKASDQIVRSGNSADIEVGHELGHIENKKKGNFIDRVVNAIASDPAVRTKYTNDISEIGLVGNHGDRGLGSILKSVLRNTVIRKEEANATKKGLEILKSSGLTGEELKRAEKHLKEAIETYKHYGRSSALVTVGNSVNVPGRRHRSIIEQLDG
jgi:hypothetical protein